MFHQSSSAVRVKNDSTLVTPQRNRSSIVQALGDSSLAATDTSSPSILRTDNSTPTKGKRKADDLEEGTPPEKRKEASGGSQKSTSFAADPVKDPRNRLSSSGIPSSYRVKRARLSAPPSDPSTSRPGSRTSRISAAQGGIPHQLPPRSQTPSRHSLSHVSVPISALISPHAPSVSRNSTFHMRDPRKPPKRPAGTPWALRLTREDEPGSPIHAWFFYLAFVLFPLWWIASFWRIPQTRQMGDDEKVAIDDPQIEHDARTWRFRCRIMSVVSLLTYIPFIILVAIFA